VSEWVERFCLGFSPLIKESAKKEGGVCAGPINANLTTRPRTTLPQTDLTHPMIKDIKKKGLTISLPQHNEGVKKIFRKWE